MIKSILKQAIRSAVPEKAKALICEHDGYASPSYSQEGEDLILAQIFSETPNGYYIDVGAHHPSRFSNTYLLNKKGWSGINIDAMPGSMKAFSADRPNDINLELAISENEESLTYYQFNEPALNGFDTELATLRDKGANEYQIIGTVTIPTQPLRLVIEKHLPRDRRIDFLNVDVEGYDLAVLKSNDWQRFRPHIVLVESMGVGDIEQLNTDPIYKFMLRQEYKLVAKTVRNLFFCEGNSHDRA